MLTLGGLYGRIRPMMDGRQQIAGKKEEIMSTKKKELFRSLKFLLFSVSAGLIEVASYALFYEALGLTEWLSHLLSLVLSVLWNFTLNRKFTFQSSANIPVAMALVALFYCVFTPLSTWWTAVLTEGMGWNAYVVLVGTMVINFVTEYLYQRLVVYRKTVDTAK